jgi:predicted  nucleic acid-binding Zn-ribbon protein
MFQEALRQLIAIQEHDSNLQKIRHKLEQLNAGKAEKVAHDEAIKAHSDAEALYKEHHSELTDSELQLKSIEEKKKKYEKRLFEGSIHNPKELDATQKEVEMLGRQRDGLDERILELWDLIEADKSQVEVSKTAETESEQTLGSRVEKYTTRKAELENAYRAIHQQRQKLAKEVEPGLLKRYESIRERHRGEALSPVRETHCTLCGAGVAVHALDALKAGDRMMTCDSCFRILYIEA